LALCHPSGYGVKQLKHRPLRSENRLWMLAA
jgi:hypothetical protein